MLIIISPLLILSVGFHSSVTLVDSAEFEYFSFFACVNTGMNFVFDCDHLCWRPFPGWNSSAPQKGKLNHWEGQKCWLISSNTSKGFISCFVLRLNLRAVMSCREAPGSVFIKFYSLWRGDGDQEGAKVWPRVFFCSCPTASSIGWRNPVGDSTEDQVQVCSWFSALNVKKEIRCALQSIIMNSLPFFRDEFFDINFSVHL